MPLTAGMLRYTWKQFIPAAVLAALSWSLVYLLPGVVLGALAIELSHAEMTKFLLAGLVSNRRIMADFLGITVFFQASVSRHQSSTSTLLELVESVFPLSAG